jgi:mannonate dehydratase
VTVVPSWFYFYGDREVSMRLAMLVDPPTDHNLQLAAQVGVADIVCIYPGLDVSVLLGLKTRVESFGMRLTHVERKIPHHRAVHNLPGATEEIDAFKTLVGNMAEASMEVLCYNWMPDDDWSRTRFDLPERGGAKVTEFNLSEVALLADYATVHDHPPTSAERLWENLTRFLDELLPVAEDAGVKLALHPDDPPLRELRGQPRIITSHDAMQRVVALAPSPMNGLCYCQGSLAPGGEDPVEGVRRLGPHIVFAHFRNIAGRAEHFRETFHDNGDIDMPAVIRAYREVGYQGAIRPDHAPSMAGETNENPGYEMLGRLYAAGYMRGLIQAAEGYRSSKGSAKSAS